MSDTDSTNTKQNLNPESFEPTVVNEFETAPRGDARIKNIDLAAIDARLDECTDFFSKHCDETDYRNLDWYLQRSQLRFAAGDDVFEVIDDMFMAARCLHDRASMHLELKPPEMFMTRRIMPVEVGIMSGMPMLTMEFAATYGIPLMMVIGKTASDDVMEEANLMTSFFRRDFCADFYELAGLSAVIYAGVLASIGRGFDDEAVVALNMYMKARDSLRGNPPASILNKIRRYDCLNTAIACVLNGQFDMVGEVLAPVAEWFAEDCAKKAGDAYLSPQHYPVPKYYDTSILTIIALAALRGKTVELPETGAIAEYRCFIKGLMEMPERRIEVPGLDEEARKILQDAGVDPDQLQNGYVDNSFHDAKEESEAKAAKLFEERQRQAQEAVRAKLAVEAAEREAELLNAEPEKYVHEQLKMTDDEGTVEASARYFDAADADDEAARRANEENATQDADAQKEAKDFTGFFNDVEEHHLNDEDADEVEHKDFSSFFSADDDRRAADEENFKAENAENEAEKPKKDFSSFFEQADADDSSIRDQVEKESVMPAEAVNTGKDFNAFFDNLQENEIPKFDDGSEEQKAIEDKARSFSGDFFTTEHKTSYDLKMTLDEEPEPVKPVEVKPVEPVKSVYEQAREARATSSTEAEFGDVQAKDFTRLFDDDAPATHYDLKMTLDDEKPAAGAASNAQTEVKKPKVLSNAERAALAEREAQIRELEEAQMAQREAAFENQHLVLNEDEAPDFARLDAHPVEALKDVQVKTVSVGDARSEQIRELEAEQQRKIEEAERAKAANALKLELDDDDEPKAMPESYAERMARLIAEKQAAAREQAIKEREEALRELEELKNQAPKKPVVEELKLTLDEPTDPDEVVEKTAPDDLVIKGFAYTELDMIHDNTAQREEVEEDFDMHAAVAQKNFEEAQKEAELKKAQDNAGQADDKKGPDIEDLIDFEKLK